MILQKLSIMFINIFNVPIVEKGCLCELPEANSKTRQIRNVCVSLLRIADLHFNPFAREYKSSTLDYLDLEISFASGYS